jgi:hypothetical protein
MTVYRISIRREGEEHDAYEYYSNRKLAESLQRKENKASGVDDSVEVIEFDLTKKGVLDMLNSWANYPDNG